MMREKMENYAERLHDPNGRRIASLNLIYDELNANEHFSELCDVKKLGIVIGIERGILNAGIEDSARTIAMPSWSNIGFITAYGTRVQFVCGAIAKYPMVVNKLISREIEWHKLCRVDFLSI